MELIFTGEFPPVKGGIGNFLWARCQAPPRGGLRVLAARSPSDGEWDASSGLDIQRFYYKHATSLASPKRGLQLWWAWNGLRRELNTRNYRLITSNVSLPFGWIATKMKKRGHRVAIFCHGLDILRPLLSATGRRLYRQAMCSADLYIANSSLTAERLMEQGWDTKRICVINPPIDPLRFNATADGSQWRKSWTGDSEGPVILSVARLDEETKGIDFVIGLLPKLKKKFPDIKYVIIGEGPLMAFYKGLARKNQVAGCTVFTGRIADEELPRCYAACDVFVLLSRQDLQKGFYEGFGIVYREAMACGKPVVASAEAGIRDIIRPGENGFLVDPRNLNEALIAITDVLEHPSLALEMGQAAIRVAAARPDWSILNDMSD